jgi:hypothetical protein
MFFPLTFLQPSLFLWFILIHFPVILIIMGAWSSVALLVGRSRDRFPVASLGIFSVVPSDGTMCPWVDSAPENEYQGFSWGKGGRCVWLTTYHPCSAERQGNPGP